MSLLLDTEALFMCRLYAFPSRELVLAYFTWRQQEAYIRALDEYCYRFITRTDQDSTSATAILADLALREKMEILRQNGFEYDQAPAWQRYGVGVYLDEAEVQVITTLPHDEQYRAFVEQRF